MVEAVNDVYNEIGSIVNAGTKLDLNYYIDDMVDEDHQDIIYDYFSQAETDSVIDAFEELKDEGISQEEIQLVGIKFISDMAN